MDLKAATLKAFMQSINSAQVDPELKRAACKHHNFKRFQQNLYEEIMKFEAHRVKLNKKRLNQSQVFFVVNSLVSTYLSAIQNEANKRAESDIAKSMREREIQKQKDLELTTSTGQMSGEFEELKNDVTIVDRDQTGVL